MLVKQTIWAAAGMAFSLLAAASQEAVQEIDVLADVFLFCLCGAGAIGGGLAAVVIHPPRRATARKMAVCWLTNTCLGLISGPAMVEWLAESWDFRVTPAKVLLVSGVAGIFAWVLVSTIFTIVEGMTWENTRDFILRILGKNQ